MEVKMSSTVAVIVSGCWFIVCCFIGSISYINVIFGSVEEQLTNFLASFIVTLYATEILNIFNVFRKELK